MRYWLGSWVWDASQFGGFWRAPDGATSSVDLRSPQQCANKITPLGKGIFTTDDATVLGTEYSDLGTDLDRPLTDEEKTVLGVTSATLRQALFDLLTVQADPNGVTSALPLVPNAGAGFELFLGNERIVSKGFRPDAPESQPLMRMLKEQYRKLRVDSLAGRTPRNHYRKVLGDWVRKYNLPHRAFQPDDLPDESPLIPETTLTDDFNRANNTVLGSSWTEVSGSIDIVTNAAEHVSAGSFSIATARFDSVLSSADHYAQFKYLNGASAGDAQPAVTARHDASAFTHYSFTTYGTNMTLWKQVAGTFTNLGNVSHSAANNDVYKVQCNGSTISGWKNGVEVIFVTDTAISGGTRGGMWTYRGSGVIPRVDDWEAADLTGIQFSNRTTHDGGFASSSSFSHTTAGTDRLLVVCVAVQEDIADRVTSVTYGGVAMTRARESIFATKNLTAYIYYLINPASGANTVAVTLAASEGHGVVALSFTGAAQSNVLDASAAATSTDNTPSVSITTGTTDTIIVDALANAINDAATPDANQTERADFTFDSSRRMYASTRVAPTAAAYTLGWTIAGGFSDDVAIAAASFKSVSLVTTVTKTHTTDAFTQFTLNKSHSTDALLRGTFTKSHTTDSKLVKNVTLETDLFEVLFGVQPVEGTKAHTTDAYMLFRFTKTHTTDALLRATATKTHTTNALLRATFTRTHSTDAYLFVQPQKPHTTDAYLRTTTTKTHSTDALLRTTNEKTHTADALLRATLTRSHTTDALLLAIQTKAHTTDALLLAIQQKTHTTDAYLVNRITTTHTTDALLLAIQQKTHTTNALLLAIQTKLHTTNALLLKTQTISHTTDALLRTENIKTHTTDALLLAIQTKVHTTDALLRKTQVASHTTDALLIPTPKTHTTDALLRTTNEKAHTTDTYLLVFSTREHMTDALLRATFTVTHSTDSLLLKTQTKVHTTDALLRATNQKTHSADALIYVRLTIAHTTDAYILKPQTKEHTTDALKLAPLVKSHSTDALLVVSRLTSHTTDADLKGTVLKTHTTNSLLVAAISKNHTTDALLLFSPTRSHSTDTYLRGRHTYIVYDETGSWLSVFVEGTEVARFKEDGTMDVNGNVNANAF